MKFSVLTLGAALIGVTLAAPPDHKPYKSKQPDGTLTPDLFLRGSVDFHWEEDTNGYTVIEDVKGYKVYATKNEKTGQLESSGIRVGDSDPKRKGLRKHVKSSSSEGYGGILEVQRHNFEGGFVPVHGRRLPINTGTLKNLVVLFRFSDHVDRSLPSPEDISQLFNSDGPNDIAPYGSVKDVYKVSSQGKLDVVTTVTPWVTLSKEEKYYGGGDSAKYTVEIFEAVTEALKLVQENKYITSFQAFDQDNDGKLDLFNVMHSGYDATQSAKDCDGAKREDRIWSQTKGFYPAFESSDGIKVSSYSLASALIDLCGSKINHIGTVAHEMGHYLGIPDLYDRNGGGKGIGAIGLMGSGHGFGRTGNKPSIMSAWSRNELKWSTTTEIEKSGRYTLQASSDSSEIYKISRGFPDGEYLLIENKQPKSFDADLPHGGLAIWHIDKEAASDYNLLNQNEGYPGQSGWPANGKHYWVALLQADGKYHLEKGNNGGDKGDLFHGEGVNRLGPSKDPMKGPFPNTDSYQHGKMKQTGIVIDRISPSADSMDFNVLFPEDVSSEASIAFAQEVVLEKAFSCTSSVDCFGALIQDVNGLLYESYFES